MDNSKKQDNSWQVDDILKELGMLDDDLYHLPHTPESEKETPPRISERQEPDVVTAGLPETREEAASSLGDDDKTKVWSIPSASAYHPTTVSKAPEVKGKEQEPSIAPTPDFPLQQTDNSDKPEDEEEELTLKQEIFEWIKAIVISFAVVFLVFGVLIKVVTVDGVSMEPTLHNNDRLVISKLFYTPEQGDIVVLSKESGLDKALIKRVIATGGQTLDIGEDGTVYVNGLPLDEPYIKEKIAANMYGQHDYPVVVPSGKVFVMGDNRNDSTDSRFAVLSFVDEKYIMGRVLLRLYPLNKIGTVN